jgi:riboflavin synthase
MFTGIIESMGLVQKMIPDQSNLLLYISSPISSELKIDQSLAHDGVCLTIDLVGDGWHRCTLIRETLEKTHFSSLQPNRRLNLERSVRSDSRIDGHFVQGHVDTVSHCIEIQSEHGSWNFKFELPEQFRQLVVLKGSICVNGVSLTISDLGTDFFQVSIIPYTYEHTTFHQLHRGDLANLEFDVLGKYIQRLVSLSGTPYLGR